MTTHDSARRQIVDALASYCRGVDRLRSADIAAAFHSEALLHGYGRDEPMSIEQFAEYVPVALGERYEATQHRITNTRIEFVATDAARVETYVEASHMERPGDNGSRRLHTFAGRYIDRCTPDDDGRWRIAERHLRNDWSTVETVTETMSGGYIASGRGDAPDPLWDIFGDRADEEREVE